MIVGRSFAGRLCASAVVVLALGSTQSLAQNGEYYTMGQGTGTISVIQGGAVVRSWAAVNGINESPIHVSDFVYTTGFNVGVTGGIYQLDGADTGGRPVHPGTIGSFFDAASDGTNSFIVDFGTKDVYSADLDYANPVRLFNAGGNVNPLGITWDDSNNSLWIADWSGTLIANYDMAGNLLSSFTSTTNLSIALAMDYTDGSLWIGDRNRSDGTFYQYDRNGNLLNTIAVGRVANHNSLGGEFQPGQGGAYFMRMSGQCPGDVTMSWSGAVPNRPQALVFGRERGEFTIPNNLPCGGTVLGLMTEVRLVDPPGIFDTGNDGSGSLSRRVGTAVCGGYLQLIQGGSCETTNVVQMP